MTQSYLEEETEIDQYPPVNKNRFYRFLKFYLIPGWRNPDFTAEDYEIGRVKSKRKLFRRLLKPLTITGMVMILVIAILGVYSPWLTPFTLENLVPPDYLPEAPYTPPSPLHPLGTTKYGFDILGRLIWGSRTALTAAALPVIIGTLGGLAVGTISAYFGGKIDALIMRFCDFWFSFPTLILVIIVAPLIGNSLYNILILFGLFGIPGSARWVRALVLQVKQNVYVRAAITGGADKIKVMFKHVFPNALSPILISLFGSMAFSVLGFASIAFLGMGDPTVTDWGTDILYSRARMTAIGPAFWPGLFIGITAIGFILLGDGLRDALDPKLKIL